MKSSKVKGQKSKLQRKVQKFLTLSFSFALFALNFAPPILAQTASPSPTPKASPTSTASATPASNGKSIRDNLRERVEEKLNKLSNKPRAFVGKITQISNSSLILQTKENTKQVKISEDTTIIQVSAKGQKTINESDLAVGEYVVAMGIIENKDTLSATRILTMTENPLRARQPVYGVVQSTDKGTFTVKHPKKDETWTVKTSSSTRVTVKADGKIEKTSVDAVAVEDRIIAVGEPVKNTTNTITAKLLHVIPGAAHGLLKSPTPSASPKATKSPAPSATP